MKSLKKMRKKTIYRWLKKCKLALASCLEIPRSITGWLPRSPLILFNSLWAKWTRLSEFDLEILRLAGVFSLWPRFGVFDSLPACWKRVNLDDILSLRNFLCNFVTFWSSQGNLSSKKSRKTKENTEEKNVSRLV